MLFSDNKKHNLKIPAKDESNEPITIASLVIYLCTNVMKDPREEMFVLDGHVFVFACILFLSVSGRTSTDDDVVRKASRNIGSHK